MTPLPPPADLLPHGKGAILLDEALAGDAGGATARVRIREGAPYAVPGEGVPAQIGLEYMAQTCGIYAGIEALALGIPPRVGYLLGTRNFHARRAWFRPGESFEITARVVLREGSIGSFACTMRDGEGVVAEAQLTVFQPEETP